MPWLKRNVRTDTGWIDITGLLPGVSSGSLWARREGKRVWLDFQNLVIASTELGGTSFSQWDSVLPNGWGPTRLAYLSLTRPASSDSAGPVRISPGGQIVVYAHTARIVGLISYLTDQPMPTTDPGAGV